MRELLVLLKHCTLAAKTFMLVRIIFDFATSGSPQSYMGMHVSLFQYVAGMLRMWWWYRSALFDNVEECVLEHNVQPPATKVPSS